MGCVEATQDAEEVDEAQSGIVGGKPMDEEPAVGALVWTQSQQFCSAFLIAPQVVMTAGHCASIAARPLLMSSSMRGLPASLYCR